jgi:hypothetical protein
MKCKCKWNRKRKGKGKRRKTRKRDSCWFLDNVIFNGLIFFLDYVDVIVIVRTY